MTRGPVGDRDRILLYGATGYTGRRVARELADRGVPTILAGRRAASLREIADPLDLDVRVGGLEEIEVEDVTAVLNCAGPFAITQKPLVDACLRAGTHYLDLAGEVDEHVSAAARDGDALSAGVMILPGAGYGIVPSDCLLAHVVARVGEPAEATIALKTVGGVSRGSAEAVLGRLRSTGVARREGRLVPARAGADRRQVDFRDGDGPVTVVTNPWRADLLSAAPEVPKLDALMAFPAPVRALIRIPHGPLLRWVARRLPEGPSEDALQRGRSAVWARAMGADGTISEAVMHGPDAYLCTARSAAICLERILDGDSPAGYQTPASAWGPDFALSVPGLKREEIERE